MRRYSLSAAVLLALVAGPLSGCAHTGAGNFASKTQKIEAQYDLARLSESEGDINRAREMYEGIYKKDPANPQVCHRLGIVHAKQSNYEAAKRFFNEAHRLKPTDPEILNDLGYTCFLSNDLPAAESALEQASKIDPRNQRAVNNLALVVGSQGRFDESFRLFRQVNKEAEAHANVAYLHAQQGEGKKALEHYSKALTLDPKMQSAANAMVEISRLQQKMEADRGIERTEIANRQPTPAVQQVSAANPAPKVEAAGIPQLNDVIADANAAQQTAEIAEIAEVAQVVTERPAPAAQAAVVTPIATPAAEPDFEDITTNDNPFLEQTVTQPAPATPAPTVSAAEPVAEPVFEVVEKVAPAVITPTPRVQPLANVADKTRVVAVQTTDFVALCPQATLQVKALLTDMNSQDVSRIKPALHKLGELAEAGTTGEPAVRAALKHSDSYVRLHAALALWRIKQNSAETVPVFVEGLRNTDPGVRSFAATAIAMGPHTDAVVGPLNDALSDSNAFVRLHAAETLFEYPGHEAAATAVLVSHLSEKEANIRWLATFIMGEILPESNTVVPALTKALKDDDHRIRAGAAFALGGMGTMAAPALPELKKLTKDERPDVRRAAEEAARDIEEDSAQASAKS